MKLVSDETKHAVRNIVDSHPRRSETPSSGRRLRSESRDLPTNPYPNDWSLDRSIFLRGVNLFETLYNETSSSSTGHRVFGAEHSRRPSQSTAVTSESAEEAIYSDPLGPQPSTSSINQNDNMATFSDAQMAQIRAMFAEQIQNNTGPTGPQGETGPPGPPGNASGIPQWRPEDIGYFDPKLPDSYGTGPMVRDGKDIWYRNVHLFIERIKDLVNTKGEDTVRTNLNTCLRGHAMMWYTSELTELERSALRTMPVAEWINALTKRFRPSHTVAMLALQTEHFGTLDIKAGREPASYVQQMVSHAKDAEFNSTQQQLRWAWLNMDAALRNHIDEPDEGTTLSSFIQKIEKKKEIWEDLYGRQPNRQISSRPNSNRPSGQNGRYQSRQGQGYGQSFGARQYPSNQFSSNQRQNFGQYNPCQSYNQQNRPNHPSSNANGRPQQQIQSGPPRLMIGAPIAAQNVSASQQPWGDQRSRPPFQPAQSNRRPQGAYQASVDDAVDKSQSQSSSDQNQTSTDTPAMSNENESPSWTSQNDEQEANNFSPDGGDPFDSYDAYGEPYDDTSNYFVSGETPLRCRRCSSQFYSNNKLHRHLRSCNRVSDKPPADQLSEDEADVNVTLPIIESTSLPFNQKGHAFRGWHYAVIEARLTPNGPEDKLCADSGCGMSLIDRRFLKGRLPNTAIDHVDQAIRVRGLGDKLHDSKEYVELDLYIQGRTKDGSLALAHIKREFHLVDNLKANVLIGMDVLGPERSVLDTDRKQLILRSCGLAVPMEIHSREGKPVNRAVRADKQLTLPPRSVTLVPTKLRGQPLPLDRDYSFHPKAGIPLEMGLEGGFSSAVTDANVAAVEARNASESPVVLPKGFLMGYVKDFDEQGCYAASPDEVPFATKTPKSDAWFKKAMKTSVGALAGFTAGSTMLSTNTSVGSALSESTSSISPNSVNLERTITSGVTIYGHTNEASHFQSIAENFPCIWEPPTGVVNVPEEEWMSIDTVPDAETKIVANKPFPTNDQDKEIIDKEFDRLHEEGKLSWTSRPTKYGFPAFVVWKTVRLPGKDPERKGRVVIDIRGLNKVTIPDSYPMPLQSDTTAAVRNAKYISVMDCASFFHQWLVQLKDRHKLTVLTYRGSEQFNVAVMGARNSPAYVQRQIDHILRPFRKFARAYVDDIVVFSDTFEDHCSHLRQIFQLFQDMHIAIKPSKTYLGYPTVALLGQKVDSLGLETSEDKLEAILSLKFPRTLKDLETYLGLTGWLRMYVPYYAQIVEPLQQRKTSMLRTAPQKGNARKAFSKGARIDVPSQRELDAFNMLQDVFRKPTFLTHHDPKRQLYVDVDASKRFGFGAIVYHVKDKVDSQPQAKGAVNDNSQYPSQKDKDKTGVRRSDIEPILFLSKCLIPAETRYWPTELEVAGLVWVVKRIKHMIRVKEADSKGDHPTPQITVYTDHAATPGIVKQTKLVSSASDKLNLRLTNASTFLSQFTMDVHHKPGKLHVVPDALSRLSNEAEIRDPPYADGILDALYGSPGPIQMDEPVPIYHTTLVEMSEDFKTRIRTFYMKNARWKRIHDIVDGLDTSDKALSEGLQFIMRDRLIYYVGDDDGRERLCVPKEMCKEIFRLTHDEQGHSGFQRTYDRITASIYMRKLSRRLREYIRHCHHCQIYQTRRHKPYGALRPIPTPSIPFNVICIDFILALPMSRMGYDTLLSATCKFSKRVLLIPGKVNYNAEEWAKKLITGLMGHDWGIPRSIISDRDPKFMSELWKGVFAALKTTMLTSTAYHPQTDGLSERTNQTVEIALRFLLSADAELDFVDVLPFLQSAINNSTSASTGACPNQVVYGFRTNDTVDLLSEVKQNVHIPALRTMMRGQAAEAIAWANINAKHYYDKSHKPFKLGDEAYLRLHHGYSVPLGDSSKKLGPQAVGPFPIKRKVGNLAYELELPPTMRIHPVISIAQLEPCPGHDPFNRPRPDSAAPVFVDGDDEKSYEIETIVGKRLVNGKKQYLLKWMDYGHQWNAWYSVDDLTDASDMVNDYEIRREQMDKDKLANRSRFKQTQGSTKRGRGRPPKNQLLLTQFPHQPEYQPEHTDPHQPKETDPPAKRGRGRPRKNDTVPGRERPQKRGRGRPRKGITQ